MSAFLIAFRPYRTLFAVILAYAAGAAMLAHAMGAGAKFLPFMYVSGWIKLLLFIAFVQVMSLCLRSMKGGGLRLTLLEWWPGFAAGALLCVGLALLHGSYTSIKTIAPDFIPFGYDVALADLDHALHGADPWRLLTWLDPFTQVIQPIYAIGWLLLVIGVTTLVALSGGPERLKQQYAWTFVLCWSLLGNLLSSLTLAAGPAYYDRVAGSPRFAALTDYLAAHDGIASAFRIQERLWAAYSDQSVGLASGISAFPSMHVSIATLFVLYAFRVSRPLGFTFLVFLVVILLGSVHLGWHYAVDGYASIAATLLLWKAVGWGVAGFPLPRLAASRTVTADAC